MTEWHDLASTLAPWDPHSWFPIEVTQKHTHQPGDTVPGDCFRSCIAAILRYERDEVPHFLRFSVRPGEVMSSIELDPESIWWWSVLGWLGANGLWLKRHELDGHDRDNPGAVADVLKLSEAVPGPGMVIGRSIRGFEHCVVAYRGEYVWDPHPSRDGLVEAWAFESFLTVPANNSWRSG